MARLWSTATRTAALQQAQDTGVDMIVIGGGITGEAPHFVSARGV